MGEGLKRAFAAAKATRAKPKKPKPGPGTALQAIRFSVTVDDHYDRLEFLNGYLKNSLDLSEWSDYVATLK
jgi:hypothetical protein